MPRDRTRATMTTAEMSNLNSSQRADGSRPPIERPRGWTKEGSAREVRTMILCNRWHEQHRAFPARWQDRPEHPMLCRKAYRAGHETVPLLACARGAQSSGLLPCSHRGVGGCGIPAASTSRASSGLRGVRGSESQHQGAHIGQALWHSAHSRVIAHTDRSAVALMGAQPANRPARPVWQPALRCSGRRTTPPAHRVTARHR